MFDHYFYKDGFKSSQALGIVKSKEGYLWIATESGLVRYDGHDFKTYMFDPNNSNTPPSNYTKSLKCDKYNRLWFTAETSICIYDIANNKFNLPKVHPLIAKSFKINLHYDTVYDKIWVMTENGIFYTQASKIDFKELNIDFNKKAYYDIEVINDSIAYVCSAYGLLEVNYLSSRILGKYTSSKSEDAGFLNIYRENNQLWIGNWVHGFSIFDIGTKKIDVYEWDHREVQQTVFDIIRYPLMNDKDIVFLATNEGLKIFNIRTRKITSFSNENLQDKSSVSGTLFSFYESSKDGLWIGGYQALHRYDPLKQIVRHVDLNIERTEKRDLSKIVLQKNKNKIDSIVWLNYDYVEVLKYDLVNGVLRSIPKKLAPYCKRNLAINDIFYDSKNRLWISNDGGKFVCYDEQKDELYIPINKEKIRVFSIAEDPNGVIFIGTTTGIYYVDEEGEEMKILPINKINNFLKENGYRGYTMSPIFDSFGRHWYACLNIKQKQYSIICYNPKSEQLLKYDNSNVVNLKHLSYVNSFIKIGKDSFSILSSNHSFLMTVQKGEPNFIDLPLKDGNGLYSNQIVIDNANNLWFSTDQGVLNYNKNSKVYSEFNSFNSKVGTKVQPYLQCSPNTGNIYIADLYGMNKIDINDIKTFRKDKIKVSDVSIKNYKNDVRIENNTVLSLNHKQNSIEIKFSFFNFTNSDENIFQYKMNGDSAWQMMNGNRLYFQEVAFGDYDIEVRGINSFGNITDNIIKFKIAVEAPFYRRWWFNFLALSLATFFIFTLFNYRDKQRQKLIQIRHAISRDLHDDMGSNLSHAKILSEIEAMKNPQNSNFDTISRKLSEVMNNMSEIVWNTNPSNDKIEHVLDRIQDYAIEILEPLGIVVRTDFADLSSQMKLDIEEKRHLYLIFKEAINNISKYSKASAVNLNAINTNKKIIISIFDNGIGFDPLIIKQGNGLINMQQRASYLKGNLKIETTNDGTNITLEI